MSNIANEVEIKDRDPECREIIFANPYLYKQFDPRMSYP
jgi:hypothetical protein